jgi:hypothetical protein
MRKNKKKRFIVSNEIIVEYLYLEIEKEFIYYLRFNEKSRDWIII